MSMDFPFVFIFLFLFRSINSKFSRKESCSCMQSERNPWNAPKTWKQQNDPTYIDLEFIVAVLASEQKIRDFERHALKSWTVICSGALVTTKWVITTAQCTETVRKLKTEKDHFVGAMVGKKKEKHRISKLVSKGEQSIRVNEVRTFLKHPDYVRNDIPNFPLQMNFGLLQLKNDYRLRPSTSIYAACFLKTIPEYFEPEARVLFKVAGHGLKSQQPSEEIVDGFTIKGSDDLKFFELDQHVLCPEVGDEFQICFNSSSQNLCLPGDDGAPLIITEDFKDEHDPRYIPGFYVIGFHARRYEGPKWNYSCQPLHDIPFARNDLALDWVRSIVGNYCLFQAKFKPFKKKLPDGLYNTKKNDNPSFVKKESSFSRKIYFSQLVLILTFFALLYGGFIYYKKNYKKKRSSE